MAPSAMTTRVFSALRNAPAVRVALGEN